MGEPGLAAPVTVDVAARLIAAQFPELKGEPVIALDAKGTDNALFRVGSDLCARFPKVAWAAGTAAREAAALPRFSGLPVPVPRVYGTGAPTSEFPFAWSVLGWLPGMTLEDSALGNADEAARQLAEFFLALRCVRPDAAFRFGPANNGRGAPLSTRTGPFRAALAKLDRVDAIWADRLWTEALRAGELAAPVWLHGDVHPGNVLVEDGRICGVIDWGLCGVGDGACDLLTAWAMFDSGAREVFRRAIGASDSEWLRGAGWALSMAVIYLPYAYEHGLRSDMSERMIARLKEDFA